MASGMVQDIFFSSETISRTGTMILYASDEISKGDEPNVVLTHVVFPTKRSSRKEANVVLRNV